MTHHLSPQEFVESLDGVLATDRLDHLHACAECRADLDRLRSVVVEVQAAEMPEPSPLFWNHFSERVRQATAAAPTPVAASWWSAAWRPVVGVAAGLAVVMLPVLLWPRSGPVALAPPVESVARVSPEAPAEPLAVDDAPWDLFLSLASALSYEDVRQVAAPRSGTADDMIEQLTPSEREALARMIHAGTGDVE